MLSIQKAVYVGNYSIHLIFNNGKESTVDLKKTIFKDKRSIFSQLRDENVYKKQKTQGVEI